MFQVSGIVEINNQIYKRSKTAWVLIINHIWFNNSSILGKENGKGRR